MAKALLIGAGFSNDLGMPTSDDLSKIFFRYFNYEIVKNYIIPKIIDMHPYGQNINLSKNAFYDILEIFRDNNETNYENFINKIEQIEYKGINNEYTHSIRYFLAIIYDKIYDFFLKFHISNFPLYAIMKSTYLYINDYISQNEETWVLSLNHDLIIEFLALDFNIPLKVGASVEQNYLLDNNKNKNEIISFYRLNRDNYDINKMDFLINQRGINLIKLHGGLNEFSFGDNGNYNYGKNLLYANYSKCKNSRDYHKLIQNINNVMAYYIKGKKAPIMKEIAAPYINKDSFELLRKSMLTGGRKFSQKLGDDSGTAMFLLRQVLKKVDVVDIIGYGFNDIHINDRLDEAMILNPNLKLNIANYSYLKIPHSITRHDCNNRIKYSYGFRTPSLLHFMVTGKQNHPENEKLEAYNTIRDSEENYKNFIKKYLTIEDANNLLIKYIEDFKSIYPLTHNSSAT